jgi:predicted nicotinamide N-methyase
VSGEPPAGFDTVEERLLVGRHSLRLLRPRSAEDLIDEAEFAVDERLPYWAELWPSGRVLADRLAAADVAGLRVIELGAGLAVPSLVAALGGADVLATDWYEPALAFARANAARAGVSLRTMLVDWRRPPEDLMRQAPFDLVVAADVLYEPRNAEPLAALLPALTGGGKAWFADPRRPDARPFLDALQLDGWGVATSEVPFEGRLDETGPIVLFHRLRPPGA